MLEKSGCVLRYKLKYEHINSYEWKHNLSDSDSEEPCDDDANTRCSMSSAIKLTILDRTTKVLIDSGADVSLRSTFAWRNGARSYPILNCPQVLT